jgi:hypothetical protein
MFSQNWLVICQRKAVRRNNSQAATVTIAGAKNKQLSNPGPVRVRQSEGAVGRLADKVP